MTNWSDWFDARLKSLGRWQRDNVQELPAAPDRRRVSIYTAEHEYRISCSPTYLGATVSKRKPYPGEDHTRGNDLADGDCNDETWLHILADIVAWETQPIYRDPEPSVRPPQETTAGSAVAESTMYPSSVDFHGDSG